MCKRLKDTLFFLAKKFRAIKKAGTVRMTVPGNMELEMQVLEPSEEDVRDSLVFYNGLG
jgi:hypothetical protein